VCVFLETHEPPPPRLGHLLLVFLLEHPPLCLGQILHCHADHVVRPDLGLGSTLLQVCHGFDKLDHRLFSETWSNDQHVNVIVSLVAKICLHGNLMAHVE
jgi:hypothetical protein